MTGLPPVVVAGDRPTGRLHLGHLVGSLEGRRRLQDSHRSIFLVADLHALTDRRGPDPELRRHCREIVLDWMSAGLDPARATFALQSRIPEIGQLAVLLSMLCPVARAERIPTLKEAATSDALSLGLLGYPVLMAADVLLFQATDVPVGEDQESHLELVRELARRFNQTYGELFPEPRPLLSDVPRLVGTDGARKMSKSLDNAIHLSDAAEEVERRVRGMFTDPQRVRSDIPGRVEGNPVFVYHELFNADRAEVEDLKNRYRAGRVGDVEVKTRLARALNLYLEPIRQRRRQLERERTDAEAILREGTARAREAARPTLDAARERMGLLAR
jgi:tryptophanyl-tRNA synthetase